MKKLFSYNLEKMLTVRIKDQTAHSLQSDLNLHCPQKLLVSSPASKALKVWIVK